MGKSKMTWDERREMHLNLHREHWRNAKDAIHQYSQTHNTEDFRRYETEYHLANKHWGIAEAMWTRRYGNI